jgi:hypothetical protein
MARYSKFGTLEDCIERSPDGCWEWKGPRDPDGYGRHRGIQAHREAYKHFVGPIGAGMIVCHSCDNPPCCNPDHLWLGNAKSNGVDSALKGRANNQYGGQSATHCINGHEYTPENTYWRPGKVAGRDCRACIRNRATSHKARKQPA